MGGRMTTAPTISWELPNENVVLVDDVKALKQVVHDEMELIGCGLHQLRVVTVLGLGNVADAVEILAIGYILTVYEDSEGIMTPWESSLLTAAVFAGMLAGGMIGGVAGDIYGRKPVLLVTLAINALAAFFSAFSPNIYWLIFFRALAGLGVGGVVATLFALCLEHVPVSARGRYVTILCSFWMIGAVVTAGTAWIMLGKYNNGERILHLSWRWFAGIVGLPSFTCLILTTQYIPESPHFLASKGDAQGVTAVLQYIHKIHQSGRQIQIQFFNEGDSVDNKKRDSGDITNLHDAICSNKSLQIVAGLFDRSNAASTLLLMLCGFSLSFGSYGLSTWITKLFQSAGLKNPFENAFLFAGANLPGNVVSLYLIDIIGHQRLFSGALFMSALCALLFAFNIEGSKTIIVLVSCLFSACTTAAWNGFGVLSAESFPQEFRTTGIAVVNCSNRVAAITSQFVNGFLMGPPPHLMALLLVTTVIMCTGGIASRWISIYEIDRGDNIFKSEIIDPAQDNSLNLQDDGEGEHIGLIHGDFLLREKKSGKKRDKNGESDDGER
ncbi:synaptic vesicle [Plasmopara halstedii]|uniref:Synaptic vesicle n=1 Tax=Plasmopara halstedii TaxID=4781 RepID=A0A0P1B5L4_PLAHL|nr:synaptic vesicle [Plasmopara halstedii]CEG49344.1 synaptic vesicle [Plasmopara halstedii]|eukprot:XP_024585713.1 synaptic vesicle [Plasmopara halstedii]